MAVQTVVIKAMKFDPPTIEIQAGDSVQWKNEMGMAHTSTSNDGISWTLGITPETRLRRQRLRLQKASICTTAQYTRI